MARILVTGGAGAIGSNLTNSLVQQGHEVVVLDNLVAGPGDLLDKSVALIAGSVTEDEDVERAFECKPEYVFHLAAFFANQNSVEHPCSDLDTNGFGEVSPGGDDLETVRFNPLGPFGGEMLSGVRPVLTVT